MKTHLKLFMTVVAFMATAMISMATVNPTNTIKVLDSNGDPIAGATARGGVGASFGTWHVAGVTDANGELLDIRPANALGYSYEVRVNGTTLVVGPLSAGSTFNFQTQLLTLKLETCTGTALSGGKVRWGLGANYSTTHFIGGNTSATGETSAEMFPGTYSFEMGYKATTDFKISHSFPADGATIVFKTTKVTLVHSGSIRYGGAAGISNHFVKPSMELMPGAAVKFEFSVGGTVVDIPISGCYVSGALIRLVDENSAPLANLNLGNMLNFKSRCGGSWTYNNVAFTTDANGYAFINTSCAGNNWDGKITVSVNKTSKEQVVATNSIYQVAKVTVNLKTCAGVPIAGANVEQGSGSWTPRGTTDANGQNSYYAFPGNNVVARVSYNYGSQTINAVPVVLPVTNIDFATTKVTLNGAAPVAIQVGGWPTVTFPMEMLPGTYGFRFNGKLISGVVVSGCEFSRTLLQVKNESNGPVAGATFVPACGGSWQPQVAGSTDANGCLFAEVPACMTKIKANVGSSGQELTSAQLAASGYTYTTQVLRISFINAAGAAITDGLGTIQSGGGWPTIGSFNASGYFDINSFPTGSTGYRATYNNTTEQKNFTIVAGAGVQQETFQTGQVFGSCITQYAGAGWSTFVDGMELMPGTRNFRNPLQSGTVVAGAITNLVCASKTDFEAGTTLVAYPNPATESVSFLNYAGSFEVYNSTGQLMYSGNDATISIAEWQSGLYIVRTQDQVVKFIKK